MSILRTMSRSDRRALAVGAVVLTPVLVLGRAFPRFHAWEEERVTAATEAHRHATKLERQVAQRESIAARLAAWKRSPAASESTLFVGRDAGVVSARVVDVLRSLAAGDDLVVQSIQPRVDTTRARGVVLPTVRLSATTDVEGFVSFLKDLELTGPLFRVVELSVVQADPTAAPDRPDVLKTELTVQAVAVINTEASRARPR